MKYGLTIRAFGLAMVAALATGCKSPPSTDSKTVDVIPQSSLVALGKSMPTVRVELVGIKGSEEKTFQAVKARLWFSGDPTKDETSLRTQKNEKDKDGVSAIYKMRFSAASETEKQTLKRNDPIWKRWERENVLYVMIVGDVDTAAGTKASEQEWKQIIPVHSKVDWSRSVIVVKLGTSGLEIETAYQVNE